MNSLNHIFDLTNKRALVSGGSAGIGLGMARGLVSAGADVCLWGLDQAELDTARSDLGSKTSTHALDVSFEEAVIAGVEKAVENLGGLDVVIVNAGIGMPPTRFVDSTTHDYRKVMAVNLEGAYWTLREASKVLVRQGSGGSIIVMSSLAAIQGAGRGQAYAATKAGILAMANGCAVELASSGIRVNTILPGWIATGLTGEMQKSEKFSKHAISRVPLQRWGTPDDFAGIAVYLASDASAFQTGSTIVMDGGYSIF